MKLIHTRALANLFKKAAVHRHVHRCNHMWIFHSTTNDLYRVVNSYIVITSS
jgi:hypothetical protein